MTTSLREVMNKKSADELADYIANSSKYTPQAITAAVEELKTRGRVFGATELDEINAKIQNSARIQSEDEPLFGLDASKKYEVDDPDVPLLYSKSAIRVFSILFSTIFGAVLLASNIDNRGKKWLTIGFGIIYTALSLVILNLAPLNSFYVLLLNSAGGLALTTTFWNLYVGKGTTYRPKPIWMPLLISILISIPFILAAIYG